MLILKAKFLSASELEARGDFPPSFLVSLLDEDCSDTLNLICDPATYEQVAGMDQFVDVAFRLRWRKVDLARLGGTGRGKAYRLQIVGQVEV